MKILVVLALLFSLSGKAQKLNQVYIIDSVTYISGTQLTLKIDNRSAIFSMSEGHAFLDMINKSDTIRYQAIQNMEIVPMPSGGTLKRFMLKNVESQTPMEFGLYLFENGEVGGLAFRKEDSVTIFWIKQ